MGKDGMEKDMIMMVMLLYEIKKGKGLIKKLSSGKKVEYEGEYLNGKGKEYYYDGKLLFEGEYKDGKRWNGKGYNPGGNVLYELKNGKGYVQEVYDNNKLKLECEYLWGEKNGKIKQYNCDGRLQFEGYALNGKINGKGKEYDDFRNIMFEGEYLYNYRL